MKNEWISLKNFSLVLLAGCLAFLNACKKDDAPDGGVGGGKNFPKNYLVATWTYDANNIYKFSYDSQCRLIKNEGPDYLLTFRYEPDRVLSTLTFIQPGLPADTSHREYLLDGGLTYQRTRTFSDGSVHVSKYERNPDGTIRLETNYLGGKFQGSTEYEYDPKGNPTKSTFFDENGVPTATIRSEYDTEIKNTLITGVVFFWPDPPQKPTREVTEGKFGNFTTDYSYKLDSQGRIVEETAKRSDVSEPSVTTYTYTY